jgi:hypothetical protein
MKKLLKVSWAVLFALMGIVSLTSCDDDDDDNGPSTEVPEGVYIYGTNTVATEPGTAATKFNLANLDDSKGLKVKSQEGVYAKYVYFGNNATFKFSTNLAGKQQVFGIDGSVATVPASEIYENNDQVKGDVLKASAKIDGDDFAVAEEGIYYVFFDTNTNTIVAFKVKPGIIGAATPGGWGEMTELPLKSISANGATYELTDVVMLKDEFKYRFNDGWNFFLDSNVVAFTNVGKKDGSLNVEGGDNMKNEEIGVYTIKMVFNPTLDGWASTETRTGDYTPPAKDWSTVSMGLIGSAIGSWENDQDGTHTLEGNVHIWTWASVALTVGSADNRFKFRENDKWDNNYGWGTTISVGDNLVREEDDSSFGVLADGNYKIIFKADVTDIDNPVFTVEFTKL